MPRRPTIPGVDRRQQILQAALEVFAEEGYGGASTKEIATRMGVTQGLLYFYFANKQEVFQATCAYYVQEIIAALDFADELQSTEDPATVLRRIVGRLIDEMDAPDGARLLRIMWRTEGYPAALSELPCPVRPIPLIAQHIWRGLSDYLTTLIGRDTVRAIDASLVAQLFTGSIVQLMVRRSKGDPSVLHYSRDQLVETLVDTLLYGLLQRPTA